MRDDRMRTNRARTTALHPVVYKTMIGCVVLLVGAAWAFLGREGDSALSAAVVTAFALAAVLTPLWLWRLSRRRAGARTSFREWTDSEFECADGRVEARDAAIMVLIAPLAVAVGLSALFVIALLVATGTL